MRWCIVALVAFVAGPGSLQAAGGRRIGGERCDVVVAQDGSGDYATVEEGLRALTTNAVLCVKPGTYDLHGFGRKFDVKVTMAGADAASTILENGGSLEFSKGFTIKNLTFSGYRESIFKLVPGRGGPQSGIVIENNVFTGSQDVLADRSGKGAKISDVRIIGNEFDNLSSDRGVRAIGLSGDGALENVTITHNVFRNLRSTNERKYAMAIMVGTNHTRRLDRNVDISCNTIDGLQGGTAKEPGTENYPETHGVLAYGDGITVANNIVRNVNQNRDHEAIYIKASHSRIANNVVVDGGANGGGGDITIKGQENVHNVVSGNRITGSPVGNGIHVTGEALLEDNYVSKANGRKGIVVYAKHEPVKISNNSVHAREGSIVVNDASGGEVSDNAVSAPVEVNRSQIREFGNSGSGPGSPSCRNSGFVCAESCASGERAGLDATCPAGRVCCTDPGGSLCALR